MRRLFLRRRREIPLHARIIAAVLAICLLLVGLDGCRTWQARGDVIAADKVETTNLARSLAQHAHDTLYVVDVILSGFRERMEVNGLRPDQTGRLDHAITLRLRETPMLCGLAVFDAAGVRVAGDQDPAGIVSVADRAALAHHGTQGDRSVWVGETTRSCAGGQWSLTVSRRIDDRQGRFAGIVRARVSIALLRRYYGSLAIGRRGMISLATLGGSIVARTDGGDASIGTSITSGTIFPRIRAGEAAGNFPLRLAGRRRDPAGQLPPRRRLPALHPGRPCAGRGAGGLAHQRVAPRGGQHRRVLAPGADRQPRREPGQDQAAGGAALPPAGRQLERRHRLHRPRRRRGATSRRPSPC